MQELVVVAVAMAEVGCGQLTSDMRKMQAYLGFVSETDELVTNCH